MSTPAADAGPRARILVVSPWAALWSLGVDGGVKAGVSDDNRFVDGFTRAGYELHFLRPRATARDERVHNHHYPDFFGATRWLPTALRRPLWPLLFHLLVAPRALRLARELRADVVLGHSHYATLTSWWCARRTGAVSAVKLFGVMDLVHTEWPAAKYWFKNFEQLVALKFPQDLWIVLDDGTRGDEVLRARGVPVDRIRFLPNGVDVEWGQHRSDASAARERFRLPSVGRVVLFLARLVPSKRPLDFVNAALHLIGAGRTDTTFVVAGEGRERRRCEDAVRAAGAGERVRFLGVVPHDDVPVLMDAADVFVSTSTLTNRALPTCEAMICGVPVVAYDTGDTATVVRAGETGALVDDGDVAALGDAIELLLESDSARERMAEAATRLAHELFVSWDDRVRMEIGLIEDALAARR